MSEAIVRKGNNRRSAWLRTCYKFAEKLESNPGNWAHAAQGPQGQVAMGTGQISTRAIAPYRSPAIATGGYGYGSSGTASTIAGVFEMTIYASLSNNIKVLKNSPVLQSQWHDRVWVVLKTAHERDLMRVLHEHRKSKAAYSERFPGKRNIIFL
jgi:hypothetical protein